MSFIEYIREVAKERASVGPDKTEEAIERAKAIIKTAAENGYGSVCLTLHLLKDKEGRANKAEFNYSASSIIKALKNEGFEVSSIATRSFEFDVYKILWLKDLPQGGSLEIKIENKEKEENE